MTSTCTAIVKYCSRPCNFVFIRLANHQLYNATHNAPAPQTTVVRMPTGQLSPKVPRLNPEFCKTLMRNVKAQHYLLAEENQRPFIHKQETE